MNDRKGACFVVNWKRFLLLPLLLLPVLLLTACCTGDRIYLPEDPSAGWYPTRIENELTGQDPIEGFNRTMFTVNDFVMQWIASPVGRFYGSIMPRPGVDAIERVCLNLEFPARLFSTLGSAEWKGAWDETCRFFINTTLGIAGFFDPAEHWFDIHSTESDFGQMFAIWGIGPGCTFILPCCRATNVRDTVGFIFDCAFDIKTYLPYTYLATLNRFVVSQQAYAPVVNGSVDRYKTYRFMLALYREMQLKRWMYAKKQALTAEQSALLDENGDLLADPPLPVQFAKSVSEPAGLRGNWIAQPEFFPRNSAELQTMRSVLTDPVASNDFWWLPHTLWGTNFYRKIDIRKIDRGDDEEKSRYAFFGQDPETRGEPKLAILIPGIDGTYDGKSTLAVAETYYEQGYDVVAIDSVFFWRGMKAGAGRGKLPGYIPDDAKRVAAFLGEILADLKAKGDPDFTAALKILTGWSYGAVTAAHIMADPASKDLNISRAVLINPPADLGNAMKVLDSGIRRTAEWRAEDVREILPETIGNMLITMNAHMPSVPEDATGKMHEIKMAFTVPRIREDAAAYLISMTLRGGIRDILYTQHHRQPFPQELIRNDTRWVNRNSLYDELDRIDFEQYAGKFLLPQLNTRKDYRTLLRDAGLYPLKDFLKKADHIAVLHNWNDILLSPADRTFLDETFGSRIYWFDAGGHMGNLYLKRFRNTLLKASGIEPEQNGTGKENGDGQKS